MDVDGTLTDGKIYMGNNGEMMKSFDIKDGYGINDILPTANIIPAIITGRKSKILENRCKELAIKEVHQGIKDKKTKLEGILSKKGLTYSEVAYIGDDLNDYICMKEIKMQGGLIGCPCDAVKGIKELVDYVCENKGGDGAVREFIEWIVAK